MERLTQLDFRTLLEFLRRNYIARDLAEFRSYVVSVLPRLVRSEVTGYNEVDTRSWDDKFIVSPVEALDFPDSFQLFNEHIREHPLINHLSTTQRPEVVKISDFLTHREFARTGLYRDFFRRLGTRDQIAVTLKLGKRGMVGIALNHHRDYTERDRLLLTLVRPHLAQAYENALTLSRMKEELESLSFALEHMHAATITLGGGERAFSISPLAQDLLEKYFDSRPRMAGLPVLIREWMGQQRAALNQLHATQPLVINQDGSRLEIRLLSRNGRTVQLLSERAVAFRRKMDPDSLTALGLSLREAEVLAWLARGRTNSEIGQILALSARTVQKHVEHIFQKLGVETRTAAAARAWEAAAVA